MEEKKPGNYVDTVRKVLNDFEPTPGAVSAIDIRHDSWCDLLSGHGPCNCNPEVGKPVTVAKPRPSNRGGTFYPVTWVYSQLNDLKVYAGFCGKTNGIIMLSERALEPMVVHDILVNKDGRCEEEEGCLCQVCPLNHTTGESYWKRHGHEGPPPTREIGRFADIVLPEQLRCVEPGSIVIGQNGEPAFFMFDEDHQPKI